MAITMKSMALGTQITSTSATARQLVYTANNGVAQIDQITAKNVNVASQDVYVYFKSDATTSGTLEEIQRISISPDSTAQFDKCIGHKIPASGTIQVHSNTATDTYITISGIERPQ